MDSCLGFPSPNNSMGMNARVRLVQLSRLRGALWFPSAPAQLQIQHFPKPCGFKTLLTPESYDQKCFKQDLILYIHTSLMLHTQIDHTKSAVSSIQYQELFESLKKLIMNHALHLNWSCESLSTIGLNCCQFIDRSKAYKLTSCTNRACHMNIHNTC